MRKKGQATIFIIIGIVVVLLVGIILYVTTDLPELIGIQESFTLPSEVQEIEDHIQNCVDLVAEDVALGLGLTGGYYGLPRNTFTLEGTDFQIPYYLENDITSIPSVEFIETEYENAMSGLVLDCINLDQFLPFIVTTRDITSEVTILSRSVLVQVNYPVDVSTNDALYTLEEQYFITVLANLGELRFVAEQITLYDLENPDELDKSFLLGLNTSTITYVPYEDGTYIYVLEDTTAFEGEQNYTYMFATKLELNNNTE